MEISLSIYKVIESSFHDCWSFRHFLEEATTGWLLRPQVVSVFFSADPSLTERPESISTTTFRCQPNRFPASFVLIINQFHFESLVWSEDFFVDSFGHDLFHNYYHVVGHLRVSEVQLVLVVDEFFRETLTRLLQLLHLTFDLLQFDFK